MDEEECTHEITEWGNCVGCGESIDRDPWDSEELEWEMHLARQAASLGLGRCEGRGWYHDGSEEQDAYMKNRKVQPCPYC